jgi:hypothetical protein
MSEQPLVSLEISIEANAYIVIKRLEPSLTAHIGRLIDRGYTSSEITRLIANKDVFLAGIAEMAIDYMRNTGVRPEG